MSQKLRVVQNRYNVDDNEKNVPTQDGTFLVAGELYRESTPDPLLNKDGRRHHHPAPRRHQFHLRVQSRSRQNYVFCAKIKDGFL